MVAETISLPVESQSELVITLDEESGELFHIQTRMVGSAGWSCRPTKGQMRDILRALMRVYANMEDDA